jgi:hypothetical protein
LFDLDELGDEDLGDWTREMDSELVDSSAHDEKSHEDSKNAIQSHVTGKKILVTGV